MRYLIIGAGAVGATIGALLTQSGHDVVLVARGPHLEALQRKGLRFATPRGTQVLEIPAIGGPAEIELRPDDVLLLCVKSQDTAAVLDAWAGQPVAGGGFAADLLPIVCAQNGVANEPAALRRFANVYGMLVLLPASHLEPGTVTAVSDPVVGVLILGRYPSGVDDVADRIAADLTDSRLSATVVEQVQRWKYTKLLHNLGNAIEAVCGPGDGDADVDRLRELVTAEGVSVLAAAGIEAADDAEQGAYFGRLTRREVPDAPRYGGSSWQSLSRGSRTIESAYLNGEIVLLGRLHGVPVPVNALLLRLAEQAARNGIAPGAVTAGQILAELS